MSFGNIFGTGAVSCLWKTRKCCIPRMATVHCRLAVLGLHRLSKLLPILVGLLVNTSFLQGSLYYQPKQCIDISYMGNPSKLLINLYCLIPPKWVPFNDPCFMPWLLLTILTIRPHNVDHLFVESPSGIQHASVVCRERMQQTEQLLSSLDSLYRSPWVSDFKLSKKNRFTPFFASIFLAIVRWLSIFYTLKISWGN